MSLSFGKGELPARSVLLKLHLLLALMPLLRPFRAILVLEEDSPGKIW